VKAKAYAVLLIKPGAPSVIVGAGVFGEPHPTTQGMVTVPLFEEEADEFSKACENAGLLLSCDYYDWCGDLRDDPHRGPWRDAR
jgi:hypothetical protein